MKRKYVLKKKARFFSILTILVIAATTLFYATSAYGYKAPTYRTVAVKSGDTLWDIAKRYSTSGDIRLNIYKIKKLNKLASSDIYEGTVLKIPEE